jgi:hypothetical protein
VPAFLGGEMIRTSLAARNDSDGRHQVLIAARVGASDNVSDALTNWRDDTHPIARLVVRHATRFTGTGRTPYPLFALQTIAGNQSFEDPRNAPGWARTSHRVGATVFTVDSVTGLWNSWDSRDAPPGRTRRTGHAPLMLTSDAGFTYAGARLSEQAENSVDKRRGHAMGHVDRWPWRSLVLRSLHSGERTKR